MRAVQITRLDGPASVEVVEVPEPVARPDEVLIDVHMAGVSYPEVLQSRGRYQLQPDLPFVPGAEISGIVRHAPAGCQVSAGDRVAAFPGVGGYGEVVAVPPAMVLALPDNVSFHAGAALPMNYLTVHFGLVQRGRLKAGETVLVHGAAGGVGTAAVQLAAALGARVIAVVSSAEKGEVAKQAGAHDVVDVAGFRDQVKLLTGGRGVDLVVDPVGGDRFTDSLRSLATEGRLLVIGFTGGEIPTVKVNRLLLNNLSVVGVGWGAYWLADLPYLQRQWAELVPLLEAGRLDPVIGTVYPLGEAAQALAELEDRRAAGKVLLQIR